jgi:leucyl aminopeptidase
VFAVEGGTPDTTPPTVSITAPAAGSTVSGTAVNIAANASDNVGVTQVEFLVDGVVKGTDTSSPYSFTWDSTTAANGSHSLTARASDAASNSTTSAAVGVTVSNSGVAYDSVLKAPKCAAVGSSCDSGTLLNGRNTLGPELNRPNTINTSCADGASGTFHSDESNDRLKVSTVDGTAFAAGKSVRVEATVWAYSTFSSDKLDLYYAANANSPAWTLIGTLTPTAGGAQTLSATYTLPAGTLQAVRARFRYQGSAACGTGSYDDHDDLIFAVQ